MGQPELEQRNGCLSLRVQLPDGSLGTVFMRHEDSRYVYKGPAWKWEQLKRLVPPIMEGPLAIFEGVRASHPVPAIWEKDTIRPGSGEHGSDWLAYVGRPGDNFDGYRQARRIDPHPDHLFVTYLNDRREIFNWLWVEADARYRDHPVDHEIRFGRNIFSVGRGR